MLFRQLLLALAAAIALAGCGGSAEDPVQSAGMAATRANVVSGLHTFPGMRWEYTVARTATGWNVVDLVRGGAVTTVPANARLRFADSSLALDLEGNAGQVYRLYQAAFARTPDQAGVGFWIDALERGTSLDAIAAGFVASAEYRGIYGVNPANAQVVERYYQNVLGRAGEAAGIAFWRDVLDRGAATPASVLKGFSESAENQAMVLVAIQNGIAYQEPGVGYVPVAQPGADRKVAPGKVVTLDGSGSSVAPGRSISYAWTLLSKPPGSAAVLAMSTGSAPAFLADVEGRYELGLTVSDGSATSAMARVTVDAAMWRPAEGRMPAGGNAVYLESETGDYIGAGKAYLYTGADTLFSVTPIGAGLRINLTGDEDWSGEFVPPNTQSRLQPGYYGSLARYPFHNPVNGGMEWSGEGRGCNTLAGWFIVDSVSYEGSALSAIDLRFEQRCEGGQRALHGRIRWSASGSTAAPKPAPAPAGLWTPSASVLPASGNYVYLQSTLGDYIGGGRNYTYTASNAMLNVSSNSAHLKVGVTGDEDWSGDFAGMTGMTQLEPGYYGDLQRYPFHNPVRGGLSWSGEGRGCNQLLGWFVVDSVTYVGGSMTALEMRFEQRCEGGSSALRGKIKWRADDGATSPGPVNPAPTGLWAPAAGATPASGNFVYLSSMPGDYIGGGMTRSFTDANAVLKVTATGARLQVSVNGDSWWSGDFAGMNTLGRLQPGYYGNLQRYPFHNPIRGGLSWSGDGRGCNTLSGWFAVDKVSYVQDQLSEIDLRFQQHCEGVSAALRGRIRWSAAAAP